MTRLFVSLRPPPAVRAALLGAMGGVERARWQDDGQLHLTLRFIGEVSLREADMLTEELGRICAAPFALDLAGNGHFESKGRAHTLWAALRPSEPLASLQAQVERACQSAGLAPEPRTFKPHVTLARLSGSAGPIGSWLADHQAFDAPTWPVNTFELVESTVGSSGSRYRALREFGLRA